MDPTQTTADGLCGLALILLAALAVFVSTEAALTAATVLVLGVVAFSFWTAP